MAHTPFRELVGERVSAVLNEFGYYFDEHLLNINDISMYPSRTKVSNKSK